MDRSSRPMIIIQCGKSKRHHPTAAQDLYRGGLYITQRNAAQASGLPWMIFSAKFGLVKPTRILQPYDTTINDEDRIDLGTLAEQAQRYCIDRRLIMYCSKPYVEHLERAITPSMNIEIIEPLKGLRFHHRTKRMMQITEQHQRSMNQ